MPYIYLLHCRASIDANKPVYKIGKSDKDDGTAKCFNGYTDGSVLVIALRVADGEKFEKDTTASFGLRFKPRTDYGSEMTKLMMEHYTTEATRMLG